MKVSVVIAALNEENYIGATLKTLKEQVTSHEYEIIVGDGYSTDKTADIARSFGARIAMEKNRSAAWERQAGTKISKGDVIAFTDADSQIPKEWVQGIADEFEKDKSLAMVYGPVYFDHVGALDDWFIRTIFPALMGFAAFLGAHNVVGSNMAVRKSAFMEISGFNTSLRTCEDLDLAKRISKKGKIKFSKKLHITVSSRRVKKWGYLKFVIYHLVNAFRFHLTGSSHSNYEDVR